MLLLAYTFHQNVFPQESISKIVGTVVDENDNSLSGVLITMPGIQTIIHTYSDASGKFELSLKSPIQLGTSNIITLKFEKEGYFYFPKNNSIINPKTGVLNADVILRKKPKNTITISVKDKFNRQNIENCKVKYNGIVQTSDEFGNVFILTNPEDNEFMERTIQVIKKDFYFDFDTTLTLSLVRSKGNYVIINLKPKGVSQPTTKGKCEMDTTGDFCFINNSDVNVHIRLYLKDNKYGLYALDEVQVIDIGQKDSAYIYDFKEKSYKFYATFEGNSYGSPYNNNPPQYGSKQGTIKVVKCSTRRYIFKF